MEVTIQVCFSMKQVLRESLIQVIKFREEKMSRDNNMAFNEHNAQTLCIISFYLHSKYIGIIIIHDLQMIKMKQ